LNIPTGQSEAVNQRRYRQ